MLPHHEAPTHVIIPSDRPYSPRDEYGEPEGPIPAVSRHPTLGYEDAGGPASRVPSRAPSRAPSRVPSRAPTRLTHGVRTSSPFSEEDAGEPTHSPPPRPHSGAPTHVLIRSPSPSLPPTVVRPAPTSFGPPETVSHYPSPPVVIRRSPTLGERDAGGHAPSREHAPQPIRTYLPSIAPSVPPVEHVPSEIPYSPPRTPTPGRPPTVYVPDIERDAGVPIPPPHEAEMARTVPTQAQIPSHPGVSDTQPYYEAPVPAGVPPGHGVPSSVQVPRGESIIPPSESVPDEGEGIPTVERIIPTRQEQLRQPTEYPLGAPPSGPGDLAYHDQLNERQQMVEQHEQRLEKLAQEAEDAEERREQYFRDHEDERDRIFRENEERRDHEATERRDEIYRTLEDHAALPVAPPGPVEGAPDLGPIEPYTGEPYAEESDVERPEGSIAETVPSNAPMPTSPLPPAGYVDPTAQLQQIMDLIRQQQNECVEVKAAEAARFEAMHKEATEAREQAQRECEERIRLLEEELQRTRDELEQERGVRRNEELERIERERTDVIERDAAIHAQLSDITNLVQEQQMDCTRKKELMDERWAEKQTRREQKDARIGEIFNMLQRILEDRERERLEREQERAAAAERPSKIPSPL